MKTYRIMLKGGGVAVVKAEEQSMGEGDRVLYFWQGGKVVSAFNMNEIVGFIQAENIGA
jgi:hypothetical protein